MEGIRGAGEASCSIAKVTATPGSGGQLSSVAYLFDTDAISEVLKRKPAAAYLRWLRTVARVDQFTSAVVVGELYKGAFRSADSARHLENIERRVLPSLSVLSYDVATARVLWRSPGPLGGNG